VVDDLSISNKKFKTMEKINFIQDLKKIENSLINDG
jgi:hypothetical protein